MKERLLIVFNMALEIRPISYMLLILFYSNWCLHILIGKLNPKREGIERTMVRESTTDWVTRLA